MGGKSAPSPPPPPDPKQVAGAQTATNVSTAIANAYMGNANENNPYGSVNYSVSRYEPVQDPNTGATYQIPVFQRDVGLTAPQQSMLDYQNAIGLGLDQTALQQTNRIGNLLNSPISQQDLLPGRVGTLDTPYFQGVNTDPNRYSQDALNVQHAIQERAQPYLDQQKQQLDTQLINRGFQPGTAAYNQQMDQFNRQLNDFQLGAVGQGYQTQNMLSNQQLQNVGFNNAQAINAFNSEQQAANFQNTARQQALQEQLALRNQPINEISALMSGGQVSMPQFQGYQFQPMQPAPIGQYTYQSANLAEQNYQAQLQQQQAAMSGMFGLGSSLIGGLFAMSDRRLKKNIKDLGIRLKNGLKLYAFEYLGELMSQVGVMADEVEQLKPAAVRVVRGYRAVDYRQIF